MKKYRIIVIIIITIIILLGIGYFIFKEKDKTLEITSADEIDVEIDIEEDDINFETYEMKDVALEESLKITSSGVYELTGSLKNGNITIDTTGIVKLILNNVDIYSEKTPAIIVNKANVLYIEVKENTKNSLESGSGYTNEEYEGVIYSKSNLVLCGTGELNLKSNYLDAIVSKDGLKIKEVTLNIDSNDDGIRGKDYVHIISGNINVESLGDGIKSTNTEEAKLGYVYIESGNINITSINDAIQAESKLWIKNGTFNIKTGGGSSITSTSNEWGNWRTPNNRNSSVDTESAKALKATTSILIENGTFGIDSSDDAIHSNDNIAIKNGNVNISSGDDGIHADTSVVIENGTINISKSYEGLEAATITIHNGNINIIASDDGINVAGGNDSSSMGRPGQNYYNENTSQNLTINGGTINVDASGDGLDANGSIYMYGGTVYVNGPTNDGNAALDYDREFIINDGTLIATGSSGMAQSTSSTSEQNAVMIYLSASTSDSFSIKDTNGKEIISYKPSKAYNSILISTKELEKGDTYEVFINSEKNSEFVISETITIVGRTNSMGYGPGRR